MSCFNTNVIFHLSRCCLVPLFRTAYGNFMWTCSDQFQWSWLFLKENHISLLWMYVTCKLIYVCTFFFVGWIIHLELLLALWFHLKAGGLIDCFRTRWTMSLSVLGLAVRTWRRFALWVVIIVLCVRACVCVCVWERERERKREYYFWASEKCARHKRRCKQTRAHDLGGDFFTHMFKKLFVCKFAVCLGATVSWCKAEIEILHGTGYLDLKLKEADVQFSVWSNSRKKTTLGGISWGTIEWKLGWVLALHCLCFDKYYVCLF